MPGFGLFGDERQVIESSLHLNPQQTTAALRELVILFKQQHAYVRIKTSSNPKMPFCWKEIQRLH